MTAALAAIFSLTVLALAMRHARSLERLTALHDQRIDRLVSFQREDRETWAAERRGLHANFTTERLGWERERGTLLNRIKPETRQYVPLAPADKPEMPLPVAYDDDEAFQTELESREELAKRLAMEEVNGRAG
jgi:hypothetical protein